MAGRSRGWLINGPEREVNHYVDITGTFDRKVAAMPPALGAQGYPSRPGNTPQGRFAIPNSESGGSSSQGRGQAPSPLMWRRPSPT